VNQILDRLKKIPFLTLLDSPNTHSYPMSMFYDTEWHMTEEGGRLRSLKIAAALKNNLNKHSLR
jgi:hypothetical protein